MDIHRLPEIRDYWSSDVMLGLPFVFTIMTPSRFECIRTYLYFSNNWDVSSSRACKIQPVISHFNMSFQNAVSPSTGCFKCNIPLYY